MALHHRGVDIVRVGCATLIVGAAGLGGCGVVGPKSIAAGRGTYAEVINQTEDEQILNVIVRMRYDETFGMMSVASVTANLKFTAQAGANVGIGSSDDYATNLVPLSAGVAYEENPTISYVPLSGEDFMQRMLIPVSTDEWVLLGASAEHPGRIFALAVRRINGLRSPVGGREGPSIDYMRFLALYDQLRRAGVLELVRGPDAGNAPEFFWSFHDYADAHRDSVRECIQLLGLDMNVDGSMILVPLRTMVGSSTSAAHVQMRSAWEVLRAFGAGIELPAEHIEAGIVERQTLAVSEEQRVITIHSSERAPDDATVQVRFRDRWFYVDARDTDSKRAFAFLRAFIGMRLADPATTQRAPVLTVPTS